MSAAELFFILSMERSREGDACVWWRPDAAGYTSSLGLAGRYTREQALRHSDPPHHLVIPCHVVEVPASRAKGLAKHALKESRFDVAKKPEPTFLEQAAAGEREPIVHRGERLTVPAAVAEAVTFQNKAGGK